MKCARAWCVLLMCAAMLESSLLHAQAPGPRAVPKAPPLREREPPEPCSGLWYGKEVARTICLAQIRSEAFARAWTSGMDEHGGQLDAAMRERKLTEMETWLRRLRGTYRVEGTYSNSGGSNPVSGTAHCLGIGDGPAAPCVITATWTAPKETYKIVELDRALYRALQSLVILIGVDPGSSRIRAMLMDYRAARMSGFLIDGAVLFDGEKTMHVFPPGNLVPVPNNPLVPYFWSRILVAINPDGEVVIKILVTQAEGEQFITNIFRRQTDAIEFDLQLKREPEGDTVRPGDAL